MNIWLSDDAVRLLALVPPVRRARGARLYTQNGRRILDLWADGGRTVLGRRKGGADLAASEQIDRGLASGFDSAWKARLEKTLRQWLPGFEEFEFHASETEALLTIGEKDGGFREALRDGNSPMETLRLLASRTRRFMPLEVFGNGRLPGNAEAEAADEAVIVILPLPEAFSFGVIARKRATGAEGGTRVHPAIPAMKLAAATRALHDVLAFIKDFDCSKWEKTDSCIGGLFTRQGPWLMPVHERSEHRAVFEDCLARGVLISPEYGMPSCLPVEFEHGELAALKEVRRPLARGGIAVS